MGRVAALFYYGVNNMTNQIVKLREEMIAAGVDSVEYDEFGYFEYAESTANDPMITNELDTELAIFFSRHLRQVLLNREGNLAYVIDNGVKTTLFTVISEPVE